MVDTCLCMGAAVSIAAGLSRVEPGRPVVAFLGDSTFFHSGLSGLINASYNRARITLVVLDNRTTAMTGHQPHPGVGRTALGEAVRETDIVELARALGIGFVEVVDPCELDKAIVIAERAMVHDGVAVVVMRRECVAGRPAAGSCRVAEDRCTDCRLCVEELGCPAISTAGGFVEITDRCRGCGLCARVCPAGAVEEVVLGGTGTLFKILTAVSFPGSVKPLCAPLRTD
jgi:indolepyruvate ferredoxin oxidoreductase alpha subunit